MKIKLPKATEYDELDIPFELPFYWNDSSDDENEYSTIEFNKLEQIGDYYWQTTVTSSETGNELSISKKKLNCLGEWIMQKIYLEHPYNEARKKVFESNFEKAKTTLGIE